jgi:DNA-binding transcriptional MerR regulator
MKTSELAREARVNIQTLRYYERERLLALPPRTPAGYRRYSRRDLERVVFIKTCQQLGFTLEDIRSLAGLHDRLTPGAAGGAGEAARLEIAAIAQHRLGQIDEKLRQLTEMRAHLLALCDPPAPDVEPRCPAAGLQNAS